MRQAVITQQGRLLKVKTYRSSTQKISPPDVKRGTVGGFSRKSRKRMLEQIAKINVPSVVHFVTLTYPDHTAPLDGRQAHANLRAFFERVRRRWPHASAVWRMEIEHRKSGRFRGYAIPHFHILLFNCHDMPMPHNSDEWRPYTGWVNVAWAGVIDAYDEKPSDGSKPPMMRTDCQLLDGARAVMRYTSKYAAKPAVEDNLVSLPYLHAQGRCWGVFNRPQLPMYPLTKIALTASKSVFYNFRRAVNRKVPEIASKRRWQGFTVFSDNTSRWLDYLHHLMVTYQ